MRTPNAEQIMGIGFWSHVAFARSCGSGSEQKRERRASFSEASTYGSIAVSAADGVGTAAGPLHAC